MNGVNKALDFIEEKLKEIESQLQVLMKNGGFLTEEEIEESKKWDQITEYNWKKTKNEIKKNNN